MFLLVVVSFFQLNHVTGVVFKARADDIVPLSLGKALLNFSNFSFWCNFFFISAKAFRAQSLIGSTSKEHWAARMMDFLSQSGGSSSMIALLEWSKAESARMTAWRWTRIGLVLR